MSTQSKFKYKVSSGLSAVLCIIDLDTIPDVTPVAPAAYPIIDFLNPAEDHIKLNINEFIIADPLPVKLHSNEVGQNGHTSKPIKSISDWEQAL